MVDDWRDRQNSDSQVTAMGRRLVGCSINRVCAYVTSSSFLHLTTLLLDY